MLIDEATASVDRHTDGLIQDILKRALLHKTVLTIAHRIETIIDSDLIMVLDDGRLAEFGPPAQLLADAGSLFARMCQTAKVTLPSSSSQELARPSPKPRCGWTIRECGAV